MPSTDCNTTYSRPYIHVRTVRYIDEDDLLKVLVGRDGEIRAKRYSISLDIIKYLSSRSIDTFRLLY
jgi:hypothetical protein